MPHKENLYVSPLLTNQSLAYRNENYISHRLFPIIQVKKDTAQIVTYGMDNLRIENSLRAQGSRTNETTHGVTIGDHYILEEHALKELVADEEIENADKPIQPVVDAIDNLTDKLWVEKEKAVADFVSNASNITQTTALTTASQWSNYTQSDPIANVTTAIKTIRGTTGKKANTMAIGYNDLLTLLDHPDIIERIKYVREATGENVMGALARIFKLKEILVGDAQYNNSIEEGTDSLTDIWSDFCVIAYVEKSPTLKSRSLGFTYQKKSPRMVDSWRGSEGTDRRGTFYRVTDKYDHKPVDANCAFLYTNIV